MLLLNVLIAFVWAGLMAEFTLGNLVLGFILGYLTISLVSTDIKRHVYQTKMSRALRFFLFYVKEVLVSTLSVAWAVVRPLKQLSPAVVAVPLEPGTSDVEVTAIANLVTYTPGSLSLDITPGNTHLYVHLFRASTLERDITLIRTNYEKRVLELFR